MASTLDFGLSNCRPTAVQFKVPQFSPGFRFDNPRRTAAVGRHALSSASTVMTASVTVSVPARLHLGFLDLNGGLGRRFGSIGLAISGLRTCVSIRRASQMRVRGPERDRALHYVETMQRVIDPDTAYDVQVDEVVPSH